VPHKKTGCCPELDNNLIPPQFAAAKIRSEVVLFFLKLLVLFAEALYTTSRIHQLLFAGKKRMTLGTDFDRNPIFCGSHIESGPAGAFNGRVVVVRVDIRFHDDL
jgi:hypothetical protein